ncbi:MAG: ABC transporter ATP-binding protein [Anaerolineae bacterium]
MTWISAGKADRGRRSEYVIGSGGARGIAENSVPAPLERIPLIRLRDVSKVYPTASGGFTALKKVNAEFYPGEFVGIIGKSGSGKSTLLNMITGVDRLTEGEVVIGDTSVHHLNESQMALWRGRSIGVIYQSFQLLPTLSLLDNVLLPMDFAGKYRPRKSIERAMQLLRQVGLEEHVQKPPTRISGGQQQRVAIARALANDPPIIVADEPTGNLDSATAAGILELFDALMRQGKTIIMVTHDRSMARRFSRTLQLADGELAPR